MSSISTMNFGSRMFTSPLQRLQDEMTSQVQAGTINASDQDALGAALESIDASLKSSMEASRGSGTRPSPDEMKAKIDDLISQQVESGALTSDQATELKSIFSSAAPQGGAEGAGRPGGAGGPPPMSMGGNDGDEDDSTSSTSSSSSSSTSDIQKLLEDFIKSLQEKLNSSSTSYGASGQSGSITAALLIDFKS